MTYQEEKAKLPKHYRVDIEEFHYGFEYLHEEPYTGEMVPCKVDTFFSWKNYKKYSEEYYVKYLDQEDIEDLGFPFKASILQDFYGDVEFYKKPEVYGYMIWKLRLEHRPETQWLKLEALFEDGVWSTLFEGRIKNKSELKKVLKQIGYEKL